MKRGAALLAALACVGSAQAFSPFYFNGVLIRWDLNYTGYNPTVFNSSTKALRYWIGSETATTGNRTAELNAIRASFAQWQSIPGTAIKFEDMGITTTNVDINTQDGRNLIYFAKTTTVNGGRNNISGIAGLTLYRVSAELRIIEADSVLNAATFSWFTDFNNVSSGAFFVEAIATHEIGHMIGLDHTPLGGATVVDGGPGVGPGAGLSPDEVAAARFFYPGPSIGSQVGTISGIVRMNGAGIRGAMVTAETSGGIAISATTTDATGLYRLAALPPGDYRVHVSPLDPSSAAVQFSLFRPIDIEPSATGVTAFKPTENVDVALAAGGTKTQDFNVTAGEPPLRVQQLSKPTALQAAPSPVRYAVSINPGQTLFAGISSTSFTAETTFSITGDGITIGPMIFEQNRFGTMHLLHAAVTVASNATPGLRTIVVRRGSDLAYANGYFEVADPKPDFNFDGLNDRFQRQYFPLFTSADAAPTADPDGDRFSNAFEEATGSNPTQAQSHSFLIQRVDVDGTGATVSWVSDVGKQYRLFGKTDVAGASWAAVGTVTATNGVTQLLDAGANGNKFYRLQLLP